MRNIIKGRLRLLVLSLAAVAAFAAIGAGSASASATLQVTTDSNDVGTLTDLSVTTALSGSGTARKQYGATINLPPALSIEMDKFGSSSDMCAANSFSYISTGLGSAQTFSNANCPDTANIGTVSLGSATGSIYTVDSSPLPRLGIYFDSGVTTPYGRALITSWSGSNNAMTISVVGLPNTSTDGLSMTFGNPNRAGGLSSKYFRWTNPSSTSGICVAHPEVTGKVYTWPWIVWPPFTSFGTTTATPASLTLNGCDYAFNTSSSAQTPDAETALQTIAVVYGAGLTQYGQTIDLPKSLWANGPAWGGPKCDVSSFTSVSTGIVPGATGFTPTNCPTGSIVGTATLGAQTGSIYLVDSSPFPKLGVYFTGGVSPAYGRRLDVSFKYDEVDYYARTQLTIMGLQGNAANAGLNLNFTPPVSGQTKLFYMAPAGASACGTDYAYSKIYTVPSSGIFATSSGTLTARTPIIETGCNN